MLLFKAIYTTFNHAFPENQSMTFALLLRTKDTFLPINNRSFLRFNVKISSLSITHNVTGGLSQDRSASRASSVSPELLSSFTGSQRAKEEEFNICSALKIREPILSSEQRETQETDEGSVWNDMEAVLCLQLNILKNICIHLNWIYYNKT